jgi:hypothetical protein
MSRKPSYDNSWVRKLIPTFVRKLQKNGVSPVRSIKGLCPPGVWKSLSRGAKLSAGHYFRNLTKSPRCPIAFERKASYKLSFYRLRNIPAKGHAVDID